MKQAYTVKYDECSMVMDCPSSIYRHDVRDALDGKYLPAETQEYGTPSAFDLVSYMPLRQFKGAGTSDLL
jgi:hypothetical protein